MARCPHCDYPLPDDRERVGARCPNCRDPLYEPPGRCSRPAREDEATCALHTGMESVGYCARCNRCLCETCRTRWQGLIVCAACVDQALAGYEVDLSSADAHAARRLHENFRRALSGLVLGGTAWLLAGLTILAMYHTPNAGERSAIVFTFLGLVTLTGNILLACVAVGQSVAALRQPGPYNGLALAGLVLGGFYIGSVLGVGTLALWQS